MPADDLHGCVWRFVRGGLDLVKAHQDANSTERMHKLNHIQALLGPVDQSRGVRPPP